MKRLTYRTDYGWVGVNDQTNGVVSTNSQAVHKLADIEDIMEKYNIESVEKLDESLGTFIFSDGYDENGKEVHKQTVELYKDLYLTVIKSKNKRL